VLNARRIELYTLVLTGYKTSDGFYRLTPAQRRRVRRKEKAHDHPPDFACQRCRPGTLKDPVPAVAASTGPKTKWERD
jgi:hypothetical protein